MKPESGLSIIVMFFFVGFVIAHLMTLFPSKAVVLFLLINNVVMPIIALVGGAGIVAAIIKNRK